LSLPFVVNKAYHMSSLVILAASFFEMSCGKTDRQNGGETSTPSDFRQRA